jgi:hypothetical protein
MKNSPSQVVVLAEDLLQFNFARRYLMRLGLPSGVIRSAGFPAGRQAGEQWVRDKYAAEVIRLRQRQARGALVVVIDADRHRTGRERQLAEILDQAAQPARGPEEPVAHFVPRRNIETWILCLTGETVDEDTDYKSGNRPFASLVRLAAEEFYRWTRANAGPSAHSVPSLLAAIPEAMRLELR